MLLVSRRFPLWLVGLLLCGNAARADQVSIESLLNELIDLESMTRFPEPSYRLVQSSSREPDKDSLLSTMQLTQEDVARAGSRDIEASSETVLFQQSGPGALVRIFLRPLDQARLRLRIYIDESRRPVVEATLAELLAERFGPLSAPFCESAGGMVCVNFPIPYAAGCIVTLGSDDIMGRCVYQVTARSYPPQTRVESFSTASHESTRDIVHRAAEALSRPENPLDRQEGDFLLPVRLSRQSPSADLQVPRAGGGLVAELRLRPSTLDPATLRRTILALSFDGRTCVRVPLADFFACGSSASVYSSRMASVTADGELISYWPMPFVQRVRISLEGPGEPAAIVERRRKGGLPFPFRFLRRKEDGRKRQILTPLIPLKDEVHVEGHFVVRPYRWDGRSMYFHAGWQSHEDLPSDGDERTNLVTLSGKGTYVGTALEVANPVKDWWGDGQDSQAVDGEDTPSLLGTGAADYFGFPRDAAEIFTRPTHGQNRRDGPKDFGLSSQYRWRILDSVVYDNGFRWDFHRTNANSQAKASLSSVHFWYCDPNHSEEASYIRESDVKLPVLPVRAVPRIAGAIEGESLAIVSFDGSAPSPESRIHFEDAGPWSGDSHLVWKGSKPGHQLVLAFHAPAGGRYNVQAYLSKSSDYGICRLTINDHPESDPQDLYDAHPTRVGPIDLGEHDLLANDNRLTIEVLSSSRLASPKNCTFGLDCLVLTPADP